MKIFLLLVAMAWCVPAPAQKNIALVKKALEASPNPPLFVKDSLHKRFVLDTITISSTTSFRGLADSIGYYGKIKKVFGPYDHGKLLIQVLAKLPNTFNRLNQIFLDTSVFTLRIADSVANSILRRIQSGTASFADMAQTYSMGGEGATKGDLGWIAQGVLLPEIERELKNHKVGEIFKVRSRTGVHLIRKTATKQDTGFVLLMRVFL